MRPDIFLATIGRGSNGSNALEVTEDRAAVTAESQDNIINRVNNVSQYSPSWHYVPGIGVAGTAYAEVPGSATGDLAFTRASSKTRTNAAGVIETIGNNVPPHDYRNADGSLSTFPRLNLEPQRTNRLLQSNNFNTTWAFSGTGTVTQGATDPSGGTSAWTLNKTATNTFIFQGTTAFSGSSTFSIYAKAGTVNQLYLLHTQTVAFNAFFDLIGGTVVSSSNCVAAIIPVGGGWFRCSISATVAGPTNIRIYPAMAGSVAGTTGNILIYAAQGEDGAYPTTYIPTTTAAVTRIADTASKTGVSSLIGQGQGTLYSEFNYRNTPSDLNGRIINVRTAASDSDSILVLIIGFGANANQLQVTTFTGGVSAIPVVASTSTLIPFGRHKIAVAYQGTSYVVYLDGVLFATGTGSQPPALSVVEIGCTTLATRSLNNGISESALFPTRLSNAQLAQMTTL